MPSDAKFWELDSIFMIFTKYLQHCSTNRDWAIVHAGSEKDSPTVGTCWFIMVDGFTEDDYNQMKQWLSNYNLKINIRFVKDADCDDTTGYVATIKLSFDLNGKWNPANYIQGDIW